MMAKVKMLSAGNINMRCAEFGRGEKAYVILPGLSIKPVTDLAGLLEPRYEKFADRYRFFLFDRPEEVPEDYSIQQMAEDTVAVIKSAGIEKMELFGVSQGGMMALCAAAAHPEMVDHLIVSSTAPFITDRLKEVSERWVKMADAKDSRGLTESFVDLMFSDEYLLKNRETALRNTPEYSDEELEHFKRLIKAGKDFDIAALLGNITCPALVIGASRDAVVGADASLDIARRIGARLYIYYDYGHAVYDEAPDFIERIMGFLS